MNPHIPYCNLPALWQKPSLLFKHRLTHYFKRLLPAYRSFSPLISMKITEPVTKMQLNPHYRWCEWKHKEKHESCDNSPRDIKSWFLYSVHTPRLDESCFNGLSYQQGSITPQWFSSTWKVEHRWEWQKMRSSNHTHTHNAFLPVTANSRVITQRRRKQKLYAPSGCQHPLLTHLWYGAAVIKVPFQHSTHHDLFHCKHSLSQLNPRPLYWDINGHFKLLKKKNGSK